ncbi:MAG TPA: acyl-CoA dehydrogenase family protein [Syntrophales bacterium]|nr:acyl-CoA dehydrogenase family protein [Syntrophales bacterium]
MTARRGKKERDLRLLGQAVRLTSEDIAVRGKPGGGQLPGTLWGTMARRGLLGWSIPAAYGGTGAPYSEIRRAIESFVESGGRPGLALSWIVHLIVAKLFISGAGRRDQKRDILPAMAAGRATTSIALSEPGAGNDPKRIRSSAVKKNNRYVLKGEKAWLTNGPMADYFVVFAATDQRGDRKPFSAFLVPRRTPGLTIVDVPPLGYLEPARHCAIRMDSCAVPEAAILGRKGRAWEDLSKPFRIVEDTLLSGVILGGLGRQLKEIVRSLQDGKRPMNSGMRERIGSAAAMLEAAKQIAQWTAVDLDREGPGTTVDQKLASLQLMEQALQEDIASIREDIGGTFPSAIEAAGDDITRLIGLGMLASRARQRKWGDTLLMERKTL